MPPSQSSTTTDHTSSSAERRPAHNAGGRLSTTVQPPSRTSDDAYRTELHPAHNAGGQLSTTVRPHHSTLRHDISTPTDARFFNSSAAPPFPAHNAGKGTLAHSSSHASVNWHSLQPARTEAQNDSRLPGGTTDTYEARTLEIMQYIWDLSDNYDRLHASASSLQPYPEDSYQRLRQLYTSVRHIIDELRTDITQYTYAMGDWDVLNTEHLSEDSEWSRLMLQNHRKFFEDPAFIPKQLDEKQMDLLDYYCRTQQRIEDIIQERDEANAATHSGGFPAHNAGGPRVLSALEQQCAALRLGSQPAFADDYGRHRDIERDARCHSQASAQPLPAPKRTEWSTAHRGTCTTSQRPAAHNAVGVAPSSGPAAHNAAGNLRGTEQGAATETTARPSQNRLKTLMSNYTGRGPQLSYSGPLQVGADGKPFSGGSADAIPLSSASGAADFEPEATYQRQPSSNRRPPDQYGSFMADAREVKPKCTYCGRPHWSTKCDVYDTITKRQRRVRELKYCFLCLRGGHWTATCPKRTNEPCRYCSNGYHHQSLCQMVYSSFKERRPGPMSANKTEQAPASAAPGVQNATATPTATREPISPARSVRQEQSSVNWSRTPHPGAGLSQTPTHPGVSTVQPSRLPSAHIGPHPGVDNSNRSETKSSQDSRTDPDGLPGTRSSTTETPESMTSKDAHVSGFAEFLIQQKRLRMTDRCSQTDEMTQFDHHPGGGSGGHPGGRPDGSETHEQRAEDTSPKQPSGLNDGGVRKPINETTLRFAKIEDEDKSPLLQCLLVKAKNPWTDDTVEAVIVFDHLRMSSVISKELVRALKLPAASTPTADFDTFTGYNTSIDLFTPEGVKISIDQIATGRLPKQVRTVIASGMLLALLRKYKNWLPSEEVIYAQPHLLIGADEMVHLQYRHGPRLQGGLFLVHSLLGVALGGSLAADTDSSKASISRSSSSSTAPDANDAENHSRSGNYFLPSQRTTPLSRLNTWLQDLSVHSPAHNAGNATAFDITQDPEPAYFPAHNAGSTAANGRYEHLEPSASAPSTSGHKQRLQIPLDAKLLLVPTPTTTYIEVEEVSAAHNAVGPPKLIQDPLRSTDAELRLSQLPSPLSGTPIRASLYDAGSLLKRKTRPRYHLPEFARHILGIYTAPEPVPTVTLLFFADSPLISLLRAEWKLQRVQLPSFQQPLPTLLLNAFVLFFSPLHAPPSSVAFFVKSSCHQPSFSGFGRLDAPGPAATFFAGYDPFVAYPWPHA